MIKIISIDVQSDAKNPYDQDIKELSLELWQMLHENPDVLSDTVRIALRENVFSGVAFLVGSATFLSLEKDLESYHLHYMWKTCAEQDADFWVTESLIEACKTAYEEVQSQFPEKRLILRSFCDASHTAEIEFLSSLGFHGTRPMLLMVRDLWENNSAQPDNRGKSIRFSEVNVENDGMMKRYMEINEACFIAPDSEAELLAKIRNENAVVYGAFDVTQQKLLACVTVWKERRGYMTENVICDPEYQRCGIMSSLLSFVFEKIKEKNGENACLRVFADDFPAIQCYLKNGYQVEGVTLCMEYEKDYQALPY